MFQARSSRRAYRIICAVYEAVGTVRAWQQPIELGAGNSGGGFSCWQAPLRGAMFRLLFRRVNRTEESAVEKELLNEGIAE